MLYCADLQRASRETPMSLRLQWRRPSFLLIAFLLAPLWLHPGTTLAWESDVHYVLTFWLATQAGFSRADADDIAQGNQSYDDSGHHAAIQTMIWIVVSGDPGAARDLQLKHFPSDARLPSPPQRRLVTPNGPAARKAVEAAVGTSTSATALRALGEALHPLHDSWSHQGVPDVPFDLRPDLGCGHPAERGGWRKHDADLTHLHIEEVVQLARVTYEALLAFLKNNPKRRDHPAAKWSQLEPIVREFARAKTKAEKNAWAVKHTSERVGGAPTPVMFSSLNRLLTLPGPSGGANQVRGVRPAATPARGPGFGLPQGRTPPQSPAPKELAEEGRQFLNAWLREQDIDRAAEFVDWAALVKDGMSGAAAQPRSTAGDRVGPEVHDHASRG
jgi:hypothetical protein